MTDHLLIHGTQVIRSTEKVAAIATPETSPLTRFHVRLTVENVGTATLFVTSAITQVGYDSGNRVLELKLEAIDYAGSRDVMISRRPLTSFVEVAPGGQEVISVEVISPITLMSEAPLGLVPQPRHVSLTNDVDAIDFSISYTDRRPPTRVNRTTDRQHPAVAWQCLKHRWPADTLKGDSESGG